MTFSLDVSSLDRYTQVSQIMHDKKTAKNNSGFQRKVFIILKPNPSYSIWGAIFVPRAGIEPARPLRNTGF